MALGFGHRFDSREGLEILLLHGKMAAQLPAIAYTSQKVNQQMLLEHMGPVFFFFYNKIYKI